MILRTAGDFANERPVDAFTMMACKNTGQILGHLTSWSLLVLLWQRLVDVLGYLRKLELSGAPEIQAFLWRNLKVSRILFTSPASFEWCTNEVEVRFMLSLADRSLDLMERVRGTVHDFQLLPAASQPTIIS